MSSHKEIAQQIRAALAAQGFTVKHSHLLHAVAAMHGLPNWNTLAAQPHTPRLTGRGAWQALADKLAQYGLPPERLKVQDDGVLLTPGPGSGEEGVLIHAQATRERQPGHLHAEPGRPHPEPEALLHRAFSGKSGAAQTRRRQHLQSGGTAASFMASLFPQVGGPGKGQEALITDMQAHIEAGGTIESFMTSLGSTPPPVERLWPHIDPRRVTTGQRVSLYPDGRHAFTVQHIYKQGWNLTFITGGGVPVDLREHDELFLVQDAPTRR